MSQCVWFTASLTHSAVGSSGPIPFSSSSSLISISLTILVSVSSLTRSRAGLTWIPPLSSIPCIFTLSIYLPLFYTTTYLHFHIRWYDLQISQRYRVVEYWKRSSNVLLKASWAYVARTRVRAYRMQSYARARAPAHARICIPINDLVQPSPDCTMHSSMNRSTCQKQRKLYKRGLDYNNNIYYIEYTYCSLMLVIVCLPVKVATRISIMKNANTLCFTSSIKVADYKRGKPVRPAREFNCSSRSEVYNC